jgi:hypothetical protein
MERNAFSMKMLCTVLGAALYASSAHAAHPLITDDAGTQGAGKAQIELNGEYASDREVEAGVEDVGRAVEAAAIVSIGLTDEIDIVAGFPYQRIEAHETDASIPSFFRGSEKGVSDLSLEAKWRFLEKGGLSMALKPGVSVPTGDERKGLGAGMYGFSAYLIATQEAEPWVFHLNLGYIRNNNRADERENLYHVSLATEYRVKETARVVANIGQDHNPDKTTDRKPAFALAGIIYGITGDLDIDIGYKVGITDPEADSTVLAGMAWRF